MTLTKPDIDWLKDEFLPALAEAVKKKLDSKLDDIATKMDKFAKEVEIDEHLKISTAP